jgi:hypothetical protein
MAKLSIGQDCGGQLVCPQPRRVQGVGSSLIDRRARFPSRAWQVRLPRSRQDCICLRAQRFAPVAGVPSDQINARLNPPPNADLMDSLARGAPMRGSPPLATATGARWHDGAQARRNWKSVKALLFPACSANPCRFPKSMRERAGHCATRGQRCHGVPLR